MTFRWILFVAGRFLRSTRMSKRSIPSVLSTTGIAVGIIALIVVLAVMNGFQMGFIEDILEISSFHIRISTPSELPPEQLDRLRQLRGVRAVVPFGDIQTLAKGMFTQFEPCMVRSLPQNLWEYDRKFIEQVNIVEGRFDLESENGILVGIELANNLSAEVGSTISVMSLAGESFNVLKPESAEFVITGIFSSGYYDFDRTLAIVSLADSEVLRPNMGEYSYGVKLVDRFKDSQLASLLEKELSAYSPEISSWREYNRAFFGALRIEKQAMTILLGLIFVVVGFNIFHSLRRTVYERREDIAVLKSIGAPPGAIRTIFVLDGFLIGLTGACLGVLAGLLIAENVNHVFSVTEAIINGFLRVLSLFSPAASAQTVRIFSPSFFYLTEVPTRTVFSEVLLIFLSAIFCSITAAFLASRRISDFKPAQILRYE